MATYVNMGNVAAQRVLEKVGMVREGPLQVTPADAVSPIHHICGRSSMPRPVYELVPRQDGAITRFSMDLGAMLDARRAPFQPESSRRVRPQS